MEGNESLKKALLDNQIDTKFLEERTIFLWDAITSKTAAPIIKRLLYLEQQDKDKEITFFINSPGGEISSGLAIYDAMQNLGCPIRTICLGIAASMGAVLLVAGTKGRRSAMQHARILIHQPLLAGSFSGQVTDIQIEAQELLRMREELNEILAQHTGQNKETIAADTDRDNWLSTSEALNYGIIDELFKKKR